MLSVGVTVLAPGGVLHDVGLRVDELGHTSLQLVQLWCGQGAQKQAVVQALANGRQGALNAAQSARVGDVVGDEVGGGALNGQHSRHGFSVGLT